VELGVSGGSLQTGAKQNFNFMAIGSQVRWEMVALNQQTSFFYGKGNDNYHLRESYFISDQQLMIGCCTKSKRLLVSYYC
jgi:hypothetical protein